MLKLVFDLNPPRPAAVLDAECDKLEKALCASILQRFPEEVQARQKVLAVFHRADHAGRGTIEREGFFATLTQLNIQPSQPDAAAHWFQRYDRRGNGQMDYKAFVGSVFGFPSVPLQVPQCREIINRIRETILTRGEFSMIGLSRAFRIMDSNSNQLLSSAEFREGLIRYGIVVEDRDWQVIYRAFDSDGNGIDVTEFLSCIRGSLNTRRLKLVELAFKQLDRDGTGVVEFTEVCSLYDVSRHPDVVAKRQKPEQVMKEFIKSWDRDGDGTITLTEFIEYYKNISCSIDLDDYFELMIRNAWHLAGGTGASANTSNLRVLVVHHDDSEEVVCVVNDLGIRPKDTASVQRALERQGVTDIKRIALAF